MMVYTVVGKVDRSYTNREGRPATYKALFVTFESKVEEGLQGQKCAEYRIPEALSIKDVQVGGRYNIDFDNSSRYPKVCDISPAIK